MVVRSCIVLGKTEDFKNERITTLAKKDGNPRELSTCDLDARGDELMINPEDTPFIFLDKKGKPHAGKVADQKLDFYQAYPTRTQFAFMAAHLKHNPLSFAKTYFSQIGELHKKYDVPNFRSEGATLLAFLDEIHTFGEKMANEYMSWACGGDNLSNELVSHMMREVIGDETRYILQNLQLKGGYAYLDKCFESMSAERKKVLYTKEMQGAWTMLKGLVAKLTYMTTPFKVGEMLPMSAITKKLKGKKGVLVYGWSTTCPSCADVAPMVNRVVKNYKKSGLEVAGIAYDGEIDSKEYRRQHQAEWNDIGKIDENLLKMPETVPYFILVGADGIIRFILEGSNIDLEAELQKHGFGKVVES